MMFEYGLSVSIFIILFAGFIEVLTLQIHQMECIKNVFNQTRQQLLSDHQLQYRPEGFFLFRKPCHGSFYSIQLKNLVFLKNESTHP